MCAIAHKQNRKPAKFPEKTQEEIAKHVGCSQGRVAQVSSEFIKANKLNPPPTRKGKDGKSRPTKYARRREAAGGIHAVASLTIFASAWSGVMLQKVLLSAFVTLPL